MSIRTAQPVAAQPAAAPNRLAHVLAAGIQAGNPAPGAAIGAVATDVARNQLRTIQQKEATLLMPTKKEFLASYDAITFMVEWLKGNRGDVEKATPLFVPYNPNLLKNEGNMVRFFLKNTDFVTAASIFTSQLLEALKNFPTVPAQWNTDYLRASALVNQMIDALRRLENESPQWDRLPIYQADKGWLEDQMDVDQSGGMKRRVSFMETNTPFGVPFDTPFGPAFGPVDQ